LSLANIETGKNSTDDEAAAMTPSIKKLPRRSEQGFTLLEVIVAVTLVAVMALALWAVMRISIRSWTRGTEYIDTNQRHRSVMSMVRKQIASAYNLLALPDPTVGGVAYPIFNGTETSFQFISLNSLLFQESPGLTLVTYEIAEGSQGDYSLIERESRYYGQTPDQQNSAIPEKTTEILQKLAGCSFEYFDPGNRANPSQWVKEWDAKKIGFLPSAVSMTLSSRDPKGNLERRMIVPIQAAVADPRSIYRNVSGTIRGMP
jgi:general secretion pathway protein J